MTKLPARTTEIALKLMVVGIVFISGFLIFSYRHTVVRAMTRIRFYLNPPRVASNVFPPSHDGEWPAAGWVPYHHGPLTVPIGPRPTFAPDSANLVATLWRGRPDDIGVLQVESGPPPPLDTDYSADVLYFGNDSDPQYTVSCYEYGGRCNASGITVHIPKGAYPAGGTDHHIIIRDKATAKDVLLWEAPIPNGHGGRYSVGWGGVIDSNGDGLNAVGSTASGISALWSLRAIDLASDTINHALLVSINGESSHGYVYPAVGFDNGYFRDDYPRMGAHFWLDVPPNRLPSSCPTYAKSYLTALNKYGAYFADNANISSVFGMFAESDMSYTYAGGPSVWGPFMQSLGLSATGKSQIPIDNCGVNMLEHMHVLEPPAH